MLDFRLIGQYLPDFLSALWMTVQISLLSGIISLILGTVLGILSLLEYKVINVPIKLFNGFLRSSPLLVQLYLVHYGLPALGILLVAFQSAIIAFSLNTGSYISEIVRGGLNSIDKGQYEASKALGLSWNKTMLKVILPQVFKRILPPLISQFSYLIKDTSLAAVLAIPEITYMARSISSTTYKPIESYGVPMIMYFIIYIIFSVASKIILNAQKRTVKENSGNLMGKKRAV
ncbi:MAG: amino acid ABC transporter permease [Smithella sp.]